MKDEKSYANMEGRDVRVTGTLRFAHYPEPTPQAKAVGRPYDHFYFEADTAKLELQEKWAACNQMRLGLFVELTPENHVSQPYSFDVSCVLALGELRPGAR